MKKYIVALALFFTLSSQAFSQSEPPYGMSEIQAYSIFYENYRTGSYDMARQFGRWMIENKPRDIEGANRFSLPRQFERMITVYAELSKQATDPSISSAYIDTALTIYADAFETFSEEEIDYYEWHLNRGRFYQEYQENVENGLNKAYAEYETAFELNPENLAQAADGYYIQILLSNYVNNEERDKALAMIDTVEPMASPTLLEHIDKIQNDLFSDPVERVGFLESQLAENPEDTEIMSELIDLYDETDQRQEGIELAQRLYEMEQSFESARRLADFAKADGRNQDAINYLSEAIEMTDDTNAKKNIRLEMAEIYQNLGNLQAARQAARQASSLDGNWGQPFIRIAEIYATAVRNCTSGRQIERNDRTVYWLVLDYLDRARSVDSSTSSTVNRLYRTYEPVMPTTEMKFFQGWEAGDSFQINSSLAECYGWINESTTVR
jgi:tetratricopeptide (TPR) repeat protein